MAFTTVDIEARKKLDFASGDTVRVWSKIEDKGKYRLQAFEGLVRRIHTSFIPEIPCAVAITDLLRLEAKAVVTPNVEWVHLAASCAVFGLFPQYRIGGRVYTDGGILRSVPLWAATGLGVRKLIGINLFPGGGPWWRARWCSRWVSARGPWLGAGAPGRWRCCWSRCSARWRPR